MCSYICHTECTEGLARVLGTYKQYQNARVTMRKWQLDHTKISLYVQFYASLVLNLCLLKKLALLLGVLQYRISHFFRGAPTFTLVITTSFRQWSSSDGCSLVSQAVQDDPGAC
jgi:hypothetical protein